MHRSLAVAAAAAAAAAACLTAGCATAPRPDPTAPGSRGLRASDHQAAARDQDELERRQLMYPDLRQGVAGAPQLSPWIRTWNASTDHARLARYHRGEAARLHAAYDEACGAAPAAEVAVSPLRRHGLGGRPTARGVVIYLAPAAGPPDRLLRDMRCHRAWMMLTAHNDMDHCPLDLAGIHVTATGTDQDIAITIEVSDPALVPELQRRAATELELAAGAP